MPDRVWFDTTKFRASHRAAEWCATFNNARQRDLDTCVNLAGESPDPEVADRVVHRGGGERSPQRRRLGEARGLQLGGSPRSAFSEWLENASLTDSVPVDEADDVGERSDGVRAPVRGREGNDLYVPLHGKSTRPKRLLFEGGPYCREQYRMGRLAEGFRESQESRTGETERLKRYQAEVNRRDKYVRRLAGGVLFHLRSARDLLETIQWSIDPSESEIEETDRA